MSLTNIKRKHRLLAYGAEHKIDPPKGFNPASGGFGAPAKEYTKRIQKSLGMKPTGRWSLALSRKLPLKLDFIKHEWKWKHPLGKRIGKPPGVVWHHAAAKSVTVQTVNQWHLNNGWSGIGYQFFVTKKGEIHRGRPEWAIGAHAKGFNEWLGVCAEGNYEVEKTMPVRQLVALKYVHAYFHNKYGNIRDRRHSDLMPTACPGRYYKYDDVTRG